MADVSGRSDLGILVLAAGASKRMSGRDKLLEKIEGQPLIARMAQVALATDHPVWVTVPTDAIARETALVDLNVAIIAVDDAASGMAASFRAWAAQMPKSMRGVVVMLADMPEITTDDLLSLIGAFVSGGYNQVVRACDATGILGHPVIFPKRLFEEFSQLSGDVGAKGLLAQEDIQMVPLPKGHATTDLDTPEEWDAWRAGHQKSEKT